MTRLTIEYAEYTKFERVLCCCIAVRSFEQDLTTRDSRIRHRQDCLGARQLALLTTTYIIDTHHERTPYQISYTSTTS